MNMMISYQELVRTFPSKKRAEYRRRFKILDDIAEQVRTLNTACLCAK
ncbi:DUF535 family protein [Serratia marcescens]